MRSLRLLFLLSSLQRVTRALHQRVPSLRRRHDDTQSFEPVQVYWCEDSSQLSQRLQEMMRHSPGLGAPVYTPTPWARGSLANFALATARSRAGALRRKLEPPLSRTIECDDPDVSVEMAADSAAYNLPADAPIVMFLPTVIA